MIPLKIIFVQTSASSFRLLNSEIGNDQVEAGTTGYRGGGFRLLNSEIGNDREDILLTDFIGLAFSSP